MSSSKAVLIIGGSGFLGTHLALRLRESYKVFATYNRHRIQIPGVTCLPLNLSNRDWAKRLVYVTQPEFIIYAAGQNDIVWAEKNSQDADRIHTTGAATICNVSNILQPIFIYISNNLIFDGERGNYHESDIVLPNTALGKAKLGGENYVRSKTLTYVIVRTAPLLGRSNGLNHSLVDRLRINLSKGEPIELQDEILHNFAPISGVVDLVHRIVESGVKKRIFHYGGLTKTTDYEMGQMFAKRFGYDPRLIIARKSSRSTNMMMNPLLGPDILADYSLNSTQTIESLKIKSLFLEESFDLMDQQLVPRS